MITGIIIGASAASALWLWVIIARVEVHLRREERRFEERLARFRDSYERSKAACDRAAQTYDNLRAQQVLENVARVSRLGALH